MDPPADGGHVVSPNGAPARERITLVVPVFNKAAVLAPALESQVAAARLDGAVDIVALDHGSTDGSLELLARWPEVTVFQVAGGTIGFLRNEGARRVPNPLLVFLDCDMVVPADYFARLRAGFARTGADALGCECGIPDPPHWIERSWYRLSVRQGDGPRRYLNAGNFAVRASAFREAGGFSEELETGEDTDLCRRLEETGHRIWQLATLDVIHLDNPRSALAFFRKHRWHGLGAGRGRPFRHPDRVTLATFGWLGGTLLGSGLLLAGVVTRDWGLGATGLAAAWLVPIVALTFRTRQTGALGHLPGSLLLIHLYFAARAAALWTVLRGREDGRDRSAPEVSGPVPPTG